jgi:hypothetical protein
MGRLLFVVLFAPLGCKADVEAQEFVPAGIYAGPVTLEDTSVIVTEVDDAVLAVSFTDCDGTVCAEAALDGVIETSLGAIWGGTMPVEELEISGRHVTGKMAYEDARYKVKGTFSDDFLTLDAKISVIGHVLLDFSPDPDEELQNLVDTTEVE